MWKIYKSIYPGASRRVGGNKGFLRVYNEIKKVVYNNKRVKKILSRQRVPKYLICHIEWYWKNSDHKLRSKHQ